MQYIIDRFEGNFAILEAENGEYTGMERARLPREAGEGDVVVHELGAFRIDREPCAHPSENEGSLGGVTYKTPEA